MKHYRHLSSEEFKKLFYIQPSEFNKYTPKSQLAYALGATMYTPATKPNIADSLIQQKYLSLTSNVLCLEDAIADSKVKEAEKNLLHQIEQLNQAVEEGKISE